MRAAWWWIDRWRKSTAYTDMTLAQQGAYRNLLDELWLRNGLLPNSERILAKICGDAAEWPSIREVVMARFTLTDFGWVNHTHDEVSGQSQRRADNQKAYRDRLKVNNKPDNAADNNPDNKAASPSPSPSPSPDDPLRYKGFRKSLDPSGEAGNLPSASKSNGNGNYTRTDLKDAKRIRAGRDIPCNHEPTCRTTEGCIVKIAGEIHSKRAGAFR